MTTILIIVTSVLLIALGYNVLKTPTPNDWHDECVEFRENKDT